MVLYDNVKVNQRIEVRYRGTIQSGTVKYKGVLNGVRGEWVGVALDCKVGLHDGMIKGRRYFLCDSGHGIFTLASQIRFMSLKRCLYNTYRSVDDTPAEEDLFGTTERPREDTTGWVVEGVAERIQSPRYRDSPGSSRPQSSMLRHSVSASLPPATWLRPDTARSAYTTRSRPIHYEYENDSDDFIRSSSIPHIHMPHSALKKQCVRGWSHAPLVRHWSVHTGREDIKYSQWNDISM